MLKKKRELFLCCEECTCSSIDKCDVFHTIKKIDNRFNIVSSHTRHQLTVHSGASLQVKEYQMEVQHCFYSSSIN